MLSRLKGAAPASGDGTIQVFALFNYISEAVKQAVPGRLLRLTRPRRNSSRSSPEASVPGSPYLSRYWSASSRPGRRTKTSGCALVVTSFMLGGNEGWQKIGDGLAASWRGRNDASSRIDKLGSRSLSVSRPAEIMAAIDASSTCRVTYPNTASDYVGHRR